MCIYIYDLLNSCLLLVLKLFFSNCFNMSSSTLISGTMVDRVMSEMLKNPQIMKKAQAEVRQTFETKGEVDDIGIHELKILKLVVKETPRLHPPAPLLLPRECGERFEINGCDEIPLNPMSLLLHGRLEEMEALNSTRQLQPREIFLKSLVDYKGTNFDYIPFGSEPCLKLKQNNQKSKENRDSETFLFIRRGVCDNIFPRIMKASKVRRLGTSSTRVPKRSKNKIFEITNSKEGVKRI